MFKKKSLKDQNFEDACVSVVQAGDLQALKNLLSGKGKIDINTPIGGMGLTFLHLCAVFNQIELATFLLEKNAKVNKGETLSRKTPLHLAAYYGNLELVELLDGYSEKFSGDAAGCYPIHYASMQGHFEIVRFLIRSGEDPNSFSNIGTPLDVAIRKKNFPLVDLLSGNVGLSCLGSTGVTPQDDIDLIKRGGLSPVHLAIATGQEEIAKKLLQRFPQYPSPKMKEEWEEFQFLERFFSIESRRKLLGLLFLPEEIPHMINRIKRYVDKWKCEIREDDILSEFFQSMIQGDLDKIKSIVQKEGKCVLTTERAGYTPLHLGKNLCFSPFFEWMIEANLFSEEVEGLGFFARWCWMEAYQNAGDFFQLIAKNLEVLNLRYHVIQE